MSDAITSVKDLARMWSTSPMPCGWETIATCRARLYTAAVHTICAKSKARTSYDPAHDCHFQWAMQWLEVAEGTRPGIDPNVEFLFHVSIKPPPQTRKHLAASDS